MIAPEASHSESSSVRRTELALLLCELLDAHSDGIEPVGREVLGALVCSERV